MNEYITPYAYVGIKNNIRFEIKKDFQHKIIDIVLAASSAFYDFDVELFFNKRKNNQKVIIARYIAYYFLIKHTELRNEFIAKGLFRSRSALMRGEGIIKDKILMDKGFIKLYLQFELFVFNKLSKTYNNE